MNQEGLNRILDDHRRWLDPFKEGGSRADLRGADLRGAVLRGADLRGAVLRGADLSRAVLRGADLSDADLPAFGIPDEGELIVWKSVQEGIAKLRIPPEAKRTGSLTGRKCRAEYVETLAIYSGGEELQEAHGTHNGTVYRIGEITYPDSYNDDIREECTNGIHFWLSKDEAENW